MRFGVLGFALAVAACSAAPPDEARAQGTAFDPVAFFTGRSQGRGTLEQVMKKERSVAVESVGTPGKDGVLTLDQTVSIAGDPPKKRSWRLRSIGGGRYAGTLTDASGPVTAETVGRTIRIRYPMKGGLKVEQWLVPLPGGRAIDNRMTITKWGMEVATLRERIEKR
ncbi:DUF3833 family protein [Sphingomonas sp. LY160]|uniref:DUF3833 family protein n=1 Tax=Sphingomonas sp. LY160 TaxID=3095342 RepID=UPI002ADEABCF|nr:DUF3833 family protein [Sphingomonas sp. LY160]MEA1072905.1 DUF3833 family protein [Sphingomonas sp. LY160]